MLLLIEMTHIVKIDSIMLTGGCGLVGGAVRARGPPGQSGPPQLSQEGLQSGRASLRLCGVP